MNKIDKIVIIFLILFAIISALYWNEELNKPILVEFNGDLQSTTDLYTVLEYTDAIVHVKIPDYPDDSPKKKRINELLEELNKIRKIDKIIISEGFTQKYYKYILTNPENNFYAIRNKLNVNNYDFSFENNENNDTDKYLSYQNYIWGILPNKLRRFFQNV